MIRKVNFKNNIVFNNYIYLLIIQGSNFVLPLIALPYLVIKLGSEKFGLIMIAQSLAVFLGIIVDFGLNISATREVSILKKNKKKLSEYYWNVIFLKFLLLIFTFGILLILINSVTKFKINPDVYLLSFGLVIGQSIFPSWFFQGIEKMRIITIINVISKLFFTVSIFFFIQSPEDYILSPILNSLGFIFSGVIGFLFSVKYVNFQKPNFQKIFIIIKENLSLLISNFAVNFYTSLNTIILGFFAGDSIAGVYSSMEKLVLASKSIYVPIYQAIFPNISKNNTKQVFDYVKKMQIPIFTLGLFIFLLIFFGSNFILDIIYNSKLINSYHDVFKILGTIAFFSSLNMLYVTLYFPGVKKYKVRMKILVISGLQHLVLAIILGNFYGIYGIATAAAVTELFILIYSKFLFNREFK